MGLLIVVVCFALALGVYIGWESAKQEFWGTPIGRIEQNRVYIQQSPSNYFLLQQERGDDRIKLFLIEEIGKEKLPKKFVALNKTGDIIPVIPTAQSK